MRDNMSSVPKQADLVSDELQTTPLAAEAHFPSLVFRQEVLEARRLNESLSQFILEERNAHETGVQNSNVAAMGGWHSRNNLHTEAAFKPLVDKINFAAEAIARRLDYHPGLKLSLDRMWAVVNPPGAFNKQHLHPLSHWSGVYYVQVPDNPGKLVFCDPRPGNIMFCAQHRRSSEIPNDARLAIAYEPLEGHLMMFPGFLPHSVEPNTSNASGQAALRIAIGFNLAQSKK